jgi:hypothetical protein
MEHGYSLFHGVNYLTLPKLKAPPAGRMRVYNKVVNPFVFTSS